MKHKKKKEAHESIRKPIAPPSKRFKTEKEKQDSKYPDKWRQDSP